MGILNTILTVKRVQLGSNMIFANNETVLADSSKLVIIDGESMTIKQLFDQLNAEFTQLYTELNSFI